MVLSNSPRLNNFSLYFLSEKWKEANFNHWIFPNKPSYNLPVWSLQFKPQLQKATLAQSCQPPTPSSPGPSQTQEQYEANKHPRPALLPLQTKISLLLTTRVKVPEGDEGGRSRNKKAAKAGRKSRILTNFLLVNLYQMANVAGWWVRRKMNRRWRKMTLEVGFRRWRRFLICLFQRSPNKCLITCAEKAEFLLIKTQWFTAHPRNYVGT